MSTRWLYELAVPGTPDISSVYASYVFTAVMAASMVLARALDFWPLYTLGVVMIALQLPLLVGIVQAKLRSGLPAPVGHAQMYPTPEPFAEIGWPKALGGFVACAVATTMLALLERA